MKFLFLIPVLTTLCLISAAAELAPLRVKDGKVMPATARSGCAASTGGGGTTAAPATPRRR